jgi:hypothetical protein
MCFTKGHKNFTFSHSGTWGDTLNGKRFHLVTEVNIYSDNKVFLMVGWYRIPDPHCECRNRLRVQDGINNFCRLDVLKYVFKKANPTPPSFVAVV